MCAAVVVCCRVWCGAVVCQPCILTYDGFSSPPLLCSALQGKLAMAYGDLIHQMWMQDAGRAMAPRNFKRVIGKFKAAFSGYVDEELL